MEINYLDEISKFIFVSKYARFNEKLGRREVWEEAVSRLEEMHLKKYAFLNKEDKEKIKWAFDLVRAKRIVPSMRSLQFGGKAIEAHNPRIYNCAVRHIDSLRSFAEVFYLLLCGCGVGLGLSKHFLNRLPDLVNADDKTGTIITYVVEDDIEGWSDSVEALLNCFFKNTPYTGRKIVFDYSRIRKKGELLKTGGGKAPGYKGLKNAHQKIKALLDHIIEHKSQQRLKSINAYDILMHCADAVLSGGIRRSATSVIFDKDDIDMINAKTYLKVEKLWSFDEDGAEELGGSKYQLYIGKVKHDGIVYDVTIRDYEYKQLKEQKTIWWKRIFPHRARSNNSVLLLRNETNLKEFTEIIERTKQFGEPGFVFANDSKTLFNPCLPKWAKVLTKDGIKDLENVKIGDLIWSKEGWTKVINKWSTGVKKVYCYNTTAGNFYGTENHQVVSNGEKIEIKDAESIDIIAGEYHQPEILDIQDIMDGIVFGDGSVHKASNNLVHLCIGQDDYDYFSSEIKDLIVKHRPGLHDYAYEIQTTISSQELPKTYNRSVPDRFFYGDRNKISGFLRGLFTANGGISGDRVTLKASSFKVIEQVQTMLSSIGIKSYYTTNKSKLQKFSNGNYQIKESYDINITIDRIKFYNCIGFIQEYKTKKLEEIINKIKKPTKSIKENYDIIGVDFISEEEVFDITVDNNSHTFWNQGCNVSNCFEVGFIPVTEDGVCGVQFCNLASINGRLVSTENDFLECIEAYSIIGTLQAGYTHFPYLSKTAKQLTEEEALLGSSITGMMNSPNILLNDKILLKGSELVKKTNKIWANKIGINQATRTCVIKPEGTSSLVLGTGSGAHPHHARKYLRLVQNNTLDNVYKYFKKHNPELCEPSVWSENKTDDVIYFPIEVGPEVIIKDDITAINHLEIIKKIQKNWVNNGTTEKNIRNVSHNVSCTIVVSDKEWSDVINYLYNNREYFAAVSLVPKCGDKLYPQSPMQAITTEQDLERWNKIINNFKPVDYTNLKENDDKTNLSSELSCFGGVCEII